MSCARLQSKRSFGREVAGELQRSCQDSPGPVFLRIRLQPWLTANLPQHHHAFPRHRVKVLAAAPGPRPTDVRGSCKHPISLASSCTSLFPSRPARRSITSRSVAAHRNTPSPQRRALASSRPTIETVERSVHGRPAGELLLSRVQQGSAPFAANFINSARGRWIGNRDRL